jgi:tetratricopeptide (TPR) repeat protein
VALSSTAWAEDSSRQEAQVHFMSGRAYFDGARYADALREFEEAVRLWPKPQLYYNLGVCKEKLGRLDEARADFERYLAGVPDAPDREMVTSRIALIKLATSPRPVAEPKPEPMVAPTTNRTDLVTSPPPPKRKVWPWIVAGSAVVVVAVVAVIVGLTVGGSGDSLRTLHDVMLQ